ncbi:hypothetical protein HAX54_022327 [Datura stramonium]|uniref:Uncharacterized protein n=1 Tax=Datura stramonium TaxID=4076 RepID=A0ABS8Y4B3_DATST|nr:hypothetical protein [Datura stramonium]
MEKGGDARRRTACELPKGIGMHCLNLYVQNPIENWRYKEFLIYLGVFLAIAKLGGSSVSNDLIDIKDFFQLVVVPELQSEDINAFSYVKTSAMSFTMLVNELTKSIKLPLLSCILKLLASESNMVHSYAARCIENLLIIKDDDTRAIIRRSCEEEPNSISVFESSVFPSLQKITDDNLSELFPYVFKLFSQLVDLNGPQQLVDLMDATHEGLFQKAMEAF